MNINSIKHFISTIFIFGIFGTGTLVYHEILEEGTCPKLGFAPACYIIFLCFVIPFLTHLFNKGLKVYYLFTGLALVLATYASIGQLFGKVQCPKTENGLPVCFISFAIFTILILLKIISTKKKA